FELRAALQAGERVLAVHPVVGLQQKLAARLQDAGETTEKFLLIDQATAGMALLGPGIRAEQVQAGDAGRGQQPAGRVTALQAQHSGIAETGRLDLAQGLADTAEHALNAEKFALGMVSRQRGEEAAVAAAEL